MSLIQINLKARASKYPHDGTVLFVHGITGNSQYTFTNHKTKFDWIDELAQEFPNWHIATVDYDSSFWITLSSLAAVDEGPTIATLSLELAHELIEKRLDSQRVVFVCHSMGGLIVKNLFEPSITEIIEPLLDKLVGILFLGTPHAGADLARRLEHSLPNLSSRLVSDLWRTDYLREMDKRVAEQCVNRRISIINFIEQVPLVFRLRIVQTNESMLAWAAQSRNIEVNQNHTEISRPRSRRALQYRELSRLVDRTHDFSSEWINIFPHFIDHHFLKGAGYENPFRKERVALFVEQAFRLSLIIADNIFIHAGFYYESSLARYLVDKYEPYFLGKISLFANALDMESYTLTSQERFIPGDSHHRAYRFEPEFSRFDFIPTAESSTEKIRRAWLSTDPETFLASYEIAQEVLDKPRFVEEWANVPERLGSLAMIAKYITPLLVKVPAPFLSGKLQEFTGKTYYEGVLQRLNCKLIVGIPYLPEITPLPPAKHRIHFKKILDLDRSVSRVVRNTRIGELRELLNFINSDQGRDFYDFSRSAILGKS